MTPELREMTEDERNDPLVVAVFGLAKRYGWDEGCVREAYWIIRDAVDEKQKTMLDNLADNIAASIRARKP